MALADIVFLGHTYLDRICHAGHKPVLSPGGSLTYGAVAAVRIGKRVVAITKLAEADGELLAGMKGAGVNVVVIPSPVTSEFDVIYPDTDPEHRTIYQRKRAAPFSVAEVPPINAKVVHLAGNAEGEFPLEFIQGMRKNGRLLSTDMQGFVRQREADGEKIAFRDVPDKKAIAESLDSMKLDVLEAEILTGESDPVRALRSIAGWGCPEIVLTKSDGVLGCFAGTVGFVPFTNRNQVGRNGRGDTTFAAYLARRLTHGPEESLAFAAALVSIKLEKRGAYAGTIDDALARLATSPVWKRV